MNDFIDNLIAYESGELSNVETVAFFQDLIDTGTINNLQGNYGRFAQELIDCGHCVAS